MLIKIPYKKLIAFLLSLTIIAVSVTLLQSLSEGAQPAMITTRDLPIIILDAGHGGFDGGAVASDGSIEKDINLEITLKLYDLLLPMGFDVILVRDTDTSTEDPGLSTVRKRKISDLNNRLDLMHKYSNSIYISIHQNKIPQSQYTGTQVFYAPGVDDAELLAEEIQNSVCRLVQPENKRLTKAATKDVYLLYNAKVPAVVVECGFLSNPGELAKLKDSEYQSKLAYSIICGVLSYLKGPDLEVGN